MAGATGIASYSTTPGVNQTADGGAMNWAEQQLPSTVNNSARQGLADLRAAFNDLMWFSYGSGDQAPGVTYLGVPYLYASGTSVTVPGVNVTAVHHVGRRMRFTGAVTGTIYGTITASAFATDTTITLAFDSGALSNEALSGALSQIPNASGVCRVLPSPLVLPGNLSILQNVNNAAVAQITNQSAGAAALSAFVAANDLGDVCVMRMHSSGFTTSGGYRADGGLLVSNGAGGLTVGSGQAYPLYFMTNGVEVARFDAAGNLGMGHAPAANFPLDILRSLNALTRVSVQNLNAGNSVTSAGVVIQALNDLGNGVVTIMYGSGSTGGSSPFLADSGLILGSGAGGFSVGTNTATPFRFVIGNVEVGRFHSNGFLGIGVIPAYPLDILQNVNGAAVANLANLSGGANAFTCWVAQNDVGHLLSLRHHNSGYTTNTIYRADGSMILANGGGGLTLATTVNRNIYFCANGIEVMEVGPVGLGIVSLPGGWMGNASLSIESSNLNQISLRMGTSSGQTGVSIRTDFAVNYLELFTYQGTAVGAISTNGTTTTFSTTSDLRLKKNMQPAADPGTIIDGIEIEEFDWIADGTHVSHGIVAQKLHKVFPDAVREGVDDDDPVKHRPWMYDPSKLVPLLIAEVQSLRRRVDTLTKETRH